MIEVVGVVVHGLSRLRLDRCSFAARPGEVLGLVGPTGSGKSTAFDVMAGATSPDRGRVVLDGRDVTRKTNMLRRTVGKLEHPLQGPTDLTPGDWLEFWAQLDGVPSSEFSGRMDRACSQFSWQTRRCRIDELSLGEQRRLALIRLWLRRPKVMLLDHPGHHLDGTGLGLLTSAIRQATADGVTMILADVAPHLPVAVCDRVVCFNQGTVVTEVGRTDAAFSSTIAEAQGWSI